MVAKGTRWSGESTGTDVLEIRPEEKWEEGNRKTDPASGGREGRGDQVPEKGKKKMEKTKLRINPPRSKNTPRSEDLR